MPTRWRIFTDRETVTLGVKVTIEGNLHIPEYVVSNATAGSSAWWRLDRRLALPDFKGKPTLPTVSLSNVWYTYTIPVEPTMPGVATLNGLELPEDVMLRAIPQYGKHPWFKVVGR